MAGERWQALHVGSRVLKPFSFTAQVSCFGGKVTAFWDEAVPAS